MLYIHLGYHPVPCFMTACSIEESVTATLNGMWKRKTLPFRYFRMPVTSHAHTADRFPLFFLSEETSVSAPHFPHAAHVFLKQSLEKKKLLSTVSKRSPPNTQVVSSDRQGWQDGHLHIPKNLKGSCNDPLYWQHKAYRCVWSRKEFLNWWVTIQKWVTQLFWLGHGFTGEFAFRAVVQWLAL